MMIRKPGKRLVQAAMALSFVAIPAVAFAHENEAAGGWAELDGARLLGGVIATLAYGVLGIVLVIVGFKAFSAVLPFSVKKELEEDHNLSVGVLLAALVLGICIVVAA